jgi:hypothetical protein
LRLQRRSCQAAGCARNPELAERREIEVSAQARESQRGREGVRNRDDGDRVSGWQGCHQNRGQQAADAEAGNRGDAAGSQCRRRDQPLESLHSRADQGRPAARRAVSNAGRRAAAVLSCGRPPAVSTHAAISSSPWRAIRG